MRPFLAISALTLAAMTTTPAAATITLVDASTIQGANVLFNSGVQTGTGVQGHTQGGTLVNFAGMTIGGGDIIRANGGQARIEGALDTSTNNPNDTLLLQSLNFGLAGGGTFNNLEFNLFNGGGTTGTVSFILTDNEGQTFNFDNLALKNGENFFGFLGIAGESIANVAFTTTNGIADVRQIRLDEVGANPVPEPATWAMMLLGIGAIGVSMRRRRAASPHHLA
jgi:hypothetical protein